MKQEHSVNKAALRREAVMQEEAALAEQEHAEEKLPGGIASKSAFIDQLTAAIESTADPILAKKGRSSANCPWIRFVKAFYRFHSTKDLVKAIRRFAPETAQVSDPAEMIELVSQRVAASVNTWVQTGEVTGLPQEVENRLPPSLKKKDKKDASQVHNQLEGEGHGIEASIKSMMESALGGDFSEVKVHTGAKGAEIAKDNDAKALAVGQHIAFGEGEYQPGTLAGDALLAHELAHTQQQKGADTTQAQEQGPESAYEEEADEMAEGAMMGIWGKAKKFGKKVKNGLKSGLEIQKCNRSKPKDIIKTDDVVMPEIVKDIPTYENWILNNPTADPALLEKMVKELYNIETGALDNTRTATIDDMWVQMVGTKFKTRKALGSIPAGKTVTVIFWSRNYNKTVVFYDEDDSIRETVEKTDLDVATPDIDNISYYTVGLGGQRKAVEKKEKQVKDNPQDVNQPPLLEGKKKTLASMMQQETYIINMTL